MKLFVGFLAGVVVGLIASRAYILSLKASLKLYQYYVHERLDRQRTDGSDSEMPECTAPTETEVRRS